MDEVKGVCKDRTMWHSVVSACPQRKKALVYIFCLYISNVMGRSFADIGGVRIGDEHTHPTTPHIAQNQAQVPGHPGVLPQGDR